MRAKVARHWSHSSGKAGETLAALTFLLAVRDPRSESCRHDGRGCCVAHGCAWRCGCVAWGSVRVWVREFVSVCVRVCVAAVRVCQHMKEDAEVRS
jgi:hypothetical protein